MTTHSPELLEELLAASSPALRASPSVPSSFAPSAPCGPPSPGRGPSLMTHPPPSGGIQPPAAKQAAGWTIQNWIPHIQPMLMEVHGGSRGSKKKAAGWPGWSACGLGPQMAHPRPWSTPRCRSVTAPHEIWSALRKALFGIFGALGGRCGGATMGKGHGTLPSHLSLRNRWRISGKGQMCGRLYRERKIKKRSRYIEHTNFSHRMSFL